MLCCKSLLGDNKDYSWEVIKTGNPGMMKGVVGIGLEENFNHKCVAMIRFILSSFYLNCKSNSGLLEVWLLFIFLRSVRLVDHGV